MNIGCVKELKRYENRVGLTPGNAREYIAHGHGVFVQSGAGEGSGFPDGAYQKHHMQSKRILLYVLLFTQRLSFPNII